MTLLARIAAVAVLVLAGCGIPDQDQPTGADDNHVQVAAPSTTTSVPQGVAAQRIEVCLVSGDHLVGVPADVATPASAADAVRALAHVSRAALPDGTRSAISGPDLVAARATQHGVANVDLTAKFLEILPADQIFAIAQIVCTLTGLPGVGQVAFTQEGQPVEVPRADSSLTGAPVSRDDYAPLLPPPG